MRARPGARIVFWSTAKASVAVPVKDRRSHPEQRASVGGWKPSDGLRHGTGECALSQPKSSLSSKVFGIAAQLSATKRFLRRGCPRESLGHHFLTGPVRLNQDGRIDRRNHVDTVEQGAEFRTVADPI